MHDIHGVYSKGHPAERLLSLRALVLLFSAHAVWRGPAPCAGPRVFVLSVIIRPTNDSATSKQTNITSSLAVSLSLPHPSRARMLNSRSCDTSIILLSFHPHCTISTIFKPLRAHAATSLFSYFKPISCFTPLAYSFHLLVFSSLHMLCTL